MLLCCLNRSKLSHPLKCEFNVEAR